jgi:hypothetical protein
MKTRLPKVTPILHRCEDGFALACIPIRTGVKTSVPMIEDRSSLECRCACTTMHAHLHEGATRSSRHRRHVFIAMKIAQGAREGRLIDVADRPVTL